MGMQYIPGSNPCLKGGEKHSLATSTSRCALVKMGFGGLRSRPEVQSCGGEGSYGVTWECGVGGVAELGGVVELRVRCRGAEMQRCEVTVYGIGFRMWLKLS